MASILKSLRLLADPNRVRILLLLEREELSVAELQEILAMGQSRISTHLAQLKQAGLGEQCRQGENSNYRLKDRQVKGMLHGAGEGVAGGAGNAQGPPLRPGR